MLPSPHVEANEFVARLDHRSEAEKHLAFLDDLLLDPLSFQVPEGALSRDLPNSSALRKPASRRDQI